MIISQRLWFIGEAPLALVLSKVEDEPLCEKYGSIFRAALGMTSGCSQPGLCRLFHAKPDKKGARLCTSTCGDGFIDQTVLH